MCSLATEGTQHGCGHYIITRKVSKRDCGSKYCIFSAAHPVPCPFSCRDCDRYYKPDHSETITQRTDAYCDHCDYWLLGPGSRPHPQT